MNCKTGGVGHQAAKGHFLCLREFVLRDFPGGEFVVHVFIQGEFPLLHHVQSCRGRDRFAD
jgi:hypothetical protein